MAGVACLERLPDCACLELHQGGGKPDMRVACGVFCVLILGMTFMVFVFLLTVVVMKGLIVVVVSLLIAVMHMFVLVVVMRLHLDLINAMVGMHDFHFRVRSRDLCQPDVFERNPNGKIETRFRKGSHLPGFWFNDVGIGAGWDHDLNIYQILANLLHEMFLRCNTDKYRDSFVCDSITRKKQNKYRGKSKILKENHRLIYSRG